MVIIIIKTSVENEIEVVDSVNTFCNFVNVTIKSFIELAKSSTLLFLYLQMTLTSMHCSSMNLATPSNCSSKA